MADRDNRINHPTLDAALAHWRKITDRGTLAIIQESVELVVGRLGPISEVYEMRSGQNIILMFGGRKVRCMAISVGYLSIYTAVIDQVVDVLPASWHPSPYTPDKEWIRESTTHVDTARYPRQKEIAWGKCFGCDNLQPVGILVDGRCPDCR